LNFGKCQKEKVILAPWSILDLLLDLFFLETTSSPGLPPRPLGGLHLPGGDLPQAPGDLPHPGPDRDPRVYLIFPLLHLIGAEEEFLQEAEVQPEVEEQWEEVHCALRMFSKFTSGKLIVEKGEK
jgi:hypothetical protein